MKHGEPARAQQHPVEDHELIITIMADSKRGLAIGGVGHMVARHFKLAHDHLSEVERVFDDEDMREGSAVYS